MSRIGDESILLDFENAENVTPSKQKATDDRIIYSSRPLGWTRASFGIPVLCDFGAARDGDVQNNVDIQPEPYRAPEVILEMNWSYSVDIWNVGVLVYTFIDWNNMNGMLSLHRFGIYFKISICSMLSTPTATTGTSIISRR